MTPRMKNAVLIAGFALLAVLAVAGWTRTPNASVGANNFLSPSGVYDPNRPTYGQQQQPAYATQAPVQSAGYAPAGYAPNGYPAAGYAPAMNNTCLEQPGYTSAAYAPEPAYAYSAPRYRTYNRPRVVRTRYVEDRGEVVRSRRGRSTKKSVAIVAGSAGAGAAIGALAGGGKGAAIGALSGGAAGFIYDRLTHNR
jgi:hypothetical protein